MSKRKRDRSRFEEGRRACTYVCSFVRLARGSPHAQRCVLLSAHDAVPNAKLLRAGKFEFLETAFAAATCSAWRLGGRTRLARHVVVQSNSTAVVAHPLVCLGSYIQGVCRFSSAAPKHTKPES